MSKVRSEFSVEFSGETFVDNTSVSDWRLTYTSSVDPVATLEAIEEMAPKIGELLAKIVEGVIKSVPSVVPNDKDEENRDQDGRKIPDDLGFDLNEKGNS